jgi:hypothetical protein
MILREVARTATEVMHKTKEIKEWFADLRIIRDHSYTVHSDLSVTLHIPFIQSQIKCFELPFKFRIAERDFAMSYNTDLITLNNFPEVVGGNFRVSYCKKLVSLEHAPKTVLGYVDFEHCSRIISAKGCPQNGVKSLFFKKCFALQSLEGCPKSIEGSLDLNECINLKTLEGCPEEIGGDLLLSNCTLHSLKYLPKVVKGSIYIPTGMPATEFLRLLRIKEAKAIFTIGTLRIGDILTRHLKTRDIMECQDALIDAGLEEYAKL